MAKTGLALAPMHRICKKAGAERVSASATVELSRALEEIGLKIASEAIDYSMHAGRKTVKRRDIDMAARKIVGR